MLFKITSVLCLSVVAVVADTTLSSSLVAIPTDSLSSNIISYIVTATDVPSSSFPSNSGFATATQVASSSFPSNSGIATATPGFNGSFFPPSSFPVPSPVVVTQTGTFLTSETVLIQVSTKTFVTSGTFVTTLFPAPTVTATIVPVENVTVSSSTIFPSSTGSTGDGSTTSTGDGSPRGTASSLTVIIFATDTPSASVVTATVEDIEARGIRFLAPEAKKRCYMGCN